MGCITAQEKLLNLHMLASCHLADVAVIGVPDAVWGQKVTAVVQMTKEQTMTLTELKNWARYGDLWLKVELYHMTK